MKLQWLHRWLASSATCKVWPATTALTCKQETSESMWLLFTSSGSLVLDQIQQGTRLDCGWELLCFSSMMNGFFQHTCSLYLNTSVLEYLFSMTVSPRKHHGPVPLCFKKNGHAKVNSMPLFWSSDRIIHMRGSDREVHVSTYSIYFSTDMFGPHDDGLAPSEQRLRSFIALKGRWSASFLLDVLLKSLFSSSPSSFSIPSLFFLSHVIKWINVWRRVFFFLERKRWRELEEEKEKQGLVGEEGRLRMGG